MGSFKEVKKVHICRIRLVQGYTRTWLELHLQRALDPDERTLLFAHPSLLSRQKLDIEAVQEAANDDAHLRVCQVLADAVAGPVAEGLHEFLLVAGEPGVVAGMVRVEPLIWNRYSAESVRYSEGYRTGKF